mmetsp:Transcript_17852/g.44260  ORF Transcript_17852/g.44260 Transcript_17852/m.44260 type:complete len:813 (-) Transcript_17852:2572-5010(-)
MDLREVLKRRRETEEEKERGRDENRRARKRKSARDYEREREKRGASVFERLGAKAEQHEVVKDGKIELAGIESADFNRVKVRATSIEQEVKRWKIMVSLRELYGKLCKRILGWELPPKESFNRWLFERRERVDILLSQQQLVNDGSIDPVFPPMMSPRIGPSVVYEILEDCPRKFYPPFNFINDARRVGEQMEEYCTAVNELLSNARLWLESGAEGNEENGGSLPFDTAAAVNNDHTDVIGITSYDAEQGVFLTPLLSEGEHDGRKRFFRCVSSAQLSVDEIVAVQAELEKAVQWVKGEQEREGEAKPSADVVNEEVEGASGVRENEGGDAGEEEEAVMEEEEDDKDSENPRRGGRDGGKRKVQASINKPIPARPSHTLDEVKEKYMYIHSVCHPLCVKLYDQPARLIASALAEGAAIAADLLRQGEEGQGPLGGHGEGRFEAISDVDAGLEIHYESTLLDRPLSFSLKGSHVLRLKKGYRAPSKDFAASTFCLALRYKTLFGIGRFEGGGCQAACPPVVMDTMWKTLKVDCELFASPFNAHFSKFCSLFSDTDAVFGSRGSSLRYLAEETRKYKEVTEKFVSCSTPQEKIALLQERGSRLLSGAFEANPPFSQQVMDTFAELVIAVLDASEVWNSLLASAKREAEEVLANASDGETENMMEGEQAVANGRDQERDVAKKFIAAADACMKSLTFVVIFPKWDDPPLPASLTLLGSVHARKQVVLSSGQHNYVDGLQHLRGSGEREKMRKMAPRGRVNDPRVSHGALEKPMFTSVMPTEIHFLSNMVSVDEGLLNDETFEELSNAWKGANRRR